MKKIVKEYIIYNEPCKLSKQLFKEFFLSWKTFLKLFLNILL